MPTDLTDEERRALIELVAAAPRSISVLYEALACSYEVRRANSTWGDLMIRALMRNGESRRGIARRLSEITGDDINESTLRRWGAKPDEPAEDAGDES